MNISGSSHHRTSTPTHPYPPPARPPHQVSAPRMNCFSLISRNPVLRKPYFPMQLSHRILSFYFETVTVMRNQWCNTRRERPSSTSKPWQDTWEPKGRTQQVSARPHPWEACVLCSAPPCSDTKGWGVSGLPLDSTANSRSLDLVGAANHWKHEVLVCFCFCC